MTRINQEKNKNPNREKPPPDLTGKELHDWYKERKKREKKTKMDSLSEERLCILRARKERKKEENFLIFGNEKPPQGLYAKDRIAWYKERRWKYRQEQDRKAASGAVEKEKMVESMETTNATEGNLEGGKEAIGISEKELAMKIAGKMERRRRKEKKRKERIPKKYRESSEGVTKEKSVESMETVTNAMDGNLEVKIEAKGAEKS